MSDQKSLALKIINILHQNNYEAYLAGGCVRDQLLGKEPKDYDIATNALPDSIENLFSKTTAIGKSFGTIVVIENNHSIEVTTFRSEGTYHDGRHPEKVTFSSAKEDASRRDFTINGLFYDPIKNNVIDHVNGKLDLKNNLVKAIGDPNDRFKEDHLRMMRAIRFAHTLDFKIEDKTKYAIQENAHLISKISIERIENELSRILVESKHPGDALQTLYDVGLLKHILPEVVELIGVKQPPDHHPEGDVFTHVKLMLNHTSSSKILETFSLRELCYVVLFHDISKPEKYIEELQDDGTVRIRFLGHEKRGAEVTKSILQRLKLSNQETKKIVSVIADHMKPFQSKEMRLSSLRKMMGSSYFDLLLELHRLDGLGSKGILPSYTFLKEKLNEFGNILPKPLISGDNLLALGIKSGPNISKIIDKAYDRQLEDNITKDVLLCWIKEEFGAEGGT